MGKEILGDAEKPRGFGGGSSIARGGGNRNLSALRREGGRQRGRRGRPSRVDNFSDAAQHDLFTHGL